MVRKNNQGVRRKVISKVFLQMINVGAVLHNGIVKRLFVAFSSSRERLIPVSLVSGTEYPSTVVFVLKHKNTLRANHQYIDLCGLTVAFRNIYIKKKSSTIILKSLQRLI